MSNWKFGISPINWVNEDILTLGDHYTFEQLLNDFTSLGFTGTEMCRKFPNDANELRSRLEERGIQLASQWKGVIFTDPALRKDELEAYRKHVEFLYAMGSKHVVTCEIGGSPHADPRKLEGQTDVLRLSDQQWVHLAEGLEQAGQICKEYGMKLIYHYHASTVVETEVEIDRLMNTTDPELVHLLFDTGHAYYGGSDPLSILRKHAERIAYVHLKDVRPDVLADVREQSIAFIDAVTRGVFTVPGDGCIDFKSIFEQLKAGGYEGWMIIEAEQDPEQADPYMYASQSMNYIRQLMSKLEQN